jgi:hypothetical protein
LFVCFFLSFFLHPARLYDSSHHKQLYVLLRKCFWWQNNNQGIVSTFTRSDPVWYLHVGMLKMCGNSPCTEDSLKINKKHSGYTVFIFTNKNSSVQWTICLLHGLHSCRPKETITSMFFKCCD